MAGRASVSCSHAQGRPTHRVCYGSHHNSKLTAFANPSRILPQYFPALSLLATALSVKVRPAERT